MADIRASNSVLYCPSRNPYDNEPLKLEDPFKTQVEAFPDLCFKSHWNPSELTDRFILPKTTAAMPTDFRPLTRICTYYYTTDEGSLLDSKVTSAPPLLGGAASKNQPFSAFQHAVDVESDLQVRGRPLTKYCDNKKYLPPNPQKLSSWMQQECPEQMPMTVNQEKILSEVNRPKVTVMKSQFDCRTQEDQRNDVVSKRMFNNTTRIDRYQKAINAAKENGQQSLNNYLTLGGSQ
jgi:hypothetical protein